MARDHIIVGVHITDRVRNAVHVQNVLTAHGGEIKTRLGLNETDESAVAAATGLVLLEFVGSGAQCRALCGELEAIEGVEVKTMAFGHP